MAQLLYDTTEPKTISYNGTDVKSVYYGDTKVWPSVKSGHRSYYYNRLWDGSQKINTFTVPAGVTVIKINGNQVNDTYVKVTPLKTYDIYGYGYTSTVIGETRLKVSIKNRNKSVLMAHVYQGKEAVGTIYWSAEINAHATTISLD